MNNAMGRIMRRSVCYAIVSSYSRHYAGDRRKQKSLAPRCPPLQSGLTLATAANKKVWSEEIKIEVPSTTHVRG